MNKLIKVLSLAAAFATSSFSATGWAPAPGTQICSSPAGAFTVKAIQYVPSTTGTGKIYVFVAEYPGFVYFQYTYSGTSATAIQQANAMLSLLETAKATGTKVHIYLPNITCNTNITNNTTYDFSVVQMDSYP
jgi:hypothetical protein